MSAVLDAFAAALLDPAAPVPAGVQSRDHRPDRRRFAVYRNNVFVSLVGALESRFPVTRRLVGEEFFKAMARAFAAQHRPASPVLMHYGDDLPDFIERFASAASVPYLADVARLEARWSDAYHAADAPALALADLAAHPAAALPELRLALHPAAALLASAFAVGSIWAAHQQPTVTQRIAATAETVLITRPGLDVRVTVLPTGDAALAAALFGGATLGEAAIAAGPSCDFGRALAGLTGLGAFAAIDDKPGRAM